MKRQQLALESQTERAIQDSARSKVKHLSREDLDRLVNSNVTKQAELYLPISPYLPHISAISPLQRHQAGEEPAAQPRPQAQPQPQPQP